MTQENKPKEEEDFLLKVCPIDPAELAECEACT